MESLSLLVDGCCMAAGANCVHGIPLAPYWLPRLLDYLALDHDIQAVHSNSKNSTLNSLAVDAADQACTLPGSPSTPIIGFSSPPSPPAFWHCLGFGFERLLRRSLEHLEDMEAAVLHQLILVVILRYFLRFTRLTLLNFAYQSYRNLPTSPAHALGFALGCRCL